MSNRTLIALVSLALIAIFALFALKIGFSFGNNIPEKYLSRGDVQGIEVVYKDIPYTLNFQQQNAVINYLNQAIPVGTAPFKRDPNLQTSKMTIYRFNATPLELSFIMVDGKDLIFSAPTWNTNAYMRDISDGSFINLLKTTYDK